MIEVLDVCCPHAGMSSLTFECGSASALVRRQGPNSVHKCSMQAFLQLFQLHAGCCGVFGGHLALLQSTTSDLNELHV